MKNARRRRRPRAGPGRRLLRPCPHCAIAIGERGRPCGHRAVAASEVFASLALWCLAAVDAGASAVDAPRLNVVKLGRRCAPCRFDGVSVIVQNKGGGHGEIGFHLAKNLAGQGPHGDHRAGQRRQKEACPSPKYGELPSSVNVEWVDTLDASAVEAACGDKATVLRQQLEETGGRRAHHLRGEKSDAFYSFVSSAGMYAAKGMLKEEKKVKDPPTGQREVEICVGINHAAVRLRQR